MKSEVDVVSANGVVQVQNVQRRALTPSPGFLVALAILFALFHGVLAVTATNEKSTTADEIVHLTAGHAYNVRNDYRLQPENGNLPQRLAALPLLLTGVPLPPTTLPTWAVADVWDYGYVFFYKQGLSADEFLWLGRAMIALVSASLGLLVFFWSRNLFGWRGGFVSLALYVFCPTFLAHGALATSDLVMTFFFVASVGAWWRHLENPGIRSGTLSATALGLAFVAKFSAVLLPPMLGLIALVWAAGRASSTGWRKPLMRLARTTVGHGVVAIGIIWLFYGFRPSAFAPELADGAGFNHGWGWLLTQMGWPAKTVWALKTYHILPEAWLYGLSFVIKFSHARGAFLNGEYSLTGWVGFFPFAFVAKTTIAVLLICLVVFGSAVRKLIAHWREGHSSVAMTWLRPFTPLAVLFCFYWIFSLTSHLNIGHRHLLPIYPVVFIAAGSLGPWLDRRRPVEMAVLIALLSWHGLESLRIRPHYLAYFNQLVGGPENGWRHLVDSSLDWGQDLPAFKSWLAQHNRDNAPVFLSYFGSGEPAYEGLRVRRLFYLTLPPTPTAYVPLAAGIYGISATILVQVYSQTGGQWTSELEREYQTLREAEPLLSSYAIDTERRKELEVTLPPERWARLIERHEILRLARLCQYLQVRRQDGNAGYSILIYRLSADEVQRATGSTADWVALIAEVAAKKG